MLSVRKRLTIAMCFLLFLIVLGTVGHMVIGGGEWTLNDAFYQTIITLSTVGFTEVHPFTPEERLFSSFLIIAGVGGAAYTLSTTVQVAIEGQLNEYFGRRRMEHQIAAMRDHIVICGFGRVGQEIARELHEHAIPFVVVEQNHALEEELRRLRYAHIEGQATSDSVLRAAGVERAGALLAASDLDTDNTYIVLVARGLNPNLFIVARASHRTAENPLRQAGAHRVISPYSVAGHQMAWTVLNPTMYDIMPTGARVPSGDVVIAHLNVPTDSALIGKPIGSIGDRRLLPAILALRRGRQFISNPATDISLMANDEIFIAATASQIKTLARQTKAAVTQISGNDGGSD